MVYQSGTDTEKQPALKHAIKTMPRWKWRLLGLGLIIGCIGVGSQFVSYMKAPVPAPVTQSGPVTVSPGNSAAPGGSRGFVSGQPAAVTPDAGTSASPQATPADDSTPMWKPFMTRVGFSLFIGVIVGVIFRAFLRTAMVISALIVAAAMALSYYHILNVDMTLVKSETTQATSWLSDQGDRLKDMLFHALPSSTSAGIGFFLGLKRR